MFESGLKIYGFISFILGIFYVSEVVVEFSSENYPIRVKFHSPLK